MYLLGGAVSGPGAGPARPHRRLRRAGGGREQARAAGAGQHLTARHRRARWAWAIRLPRHNGTITPESERQMAARDDRFRHPMNSARRGSDARPGPGEHGAQYPLDLVEVLLTADQRRGKLDDRVAAVVGAAYQSGVEQRVGQEPAQQPLGLVVGERLARDLVLDHLDAVEVPGAADVDDDGQVV